MSLEGFRRQLGDDLWALAEGLGSPVVGVDRLTTRPLYGSQRASFRLNLADGRILKGRRFAKDAQAERVRYLSGFLDRRYFPSVLGRCGSALLLEWVEGERLRTGQGEPDALSHCGAVQALLHRTPLPDDAASHEQSAPHAGPARFRRRIESLVELGALGMEEGNRLFDLAATYVPDSPAIGIVHGDYCAENMVVNASGQIQVVDSGTLAIDACDYDLARTWYRWPMSAIQRKTYYDGYNRHRSAADFFNHFTYWAVLVLVQSALFRLRAQTADTWDVIRQLRALIRDDGRLRLSGLSPMVSLVPF